MTVEVFDSLNVSKGFARTLLFESNLDPNNRPIPTLGVTGMIALILGMVWLVRRNLLRQTGA